MINILTDYIIYKLNNPYFSKKWNLKTLEVQKIIIRAKMKN